ncbi:MAG TPA: hypothetical protein GXZ91_03755 [Christensenellaceae bacterium]|jgi:membrane protease YdiL (CAAX protease family)|nr:hypothetical protein [Christensenellaceae bacterium]
MNYKAANIIRFFGVIIGIIISGIFILIYGTENNFLFVIGIVVAAASFIIDLIFYRCPNCGHTLAFRPLILKLCNNCVYKFKG